MNFLKALTILTNIAGGCVVISVGFTTLPDYLAFPWALFNAWIWIAAPISVYWAAKKKEGEKHGD